MLPDIETVANTHILYTLDYERRNSPVRCTNPMAWIEWMQNNPTELSRTVLQDKREIVTVFAGYAGERHESRPYTFCTYVKPERGLNEFKIVLAWFASFNEAVGGHNAIAERFQKLKRSAPEATNAFGRIKQLR